MYLLAGKTNSIVYLVLSLFPDSEYEHIEKINSEYRALSEYEELKKFSNKSICDFWTEVSLVKNEHGKQMFANIFRIAQGILSLPHSSANIERIFSIHNLIKTKCRNRLATSTCDSLLQTRDLLKANNSQCYNFQIPLEMLTKKAANISIEEELLE